MRGALVKNIYAMQCVFIDGDSEKKKRRKKDEK